MDDLLGCGNRGGLTGAVPTPFSFLCKKLVYLFEHLVKLLAQLFPSLDGLGICSRRRVVWITISMAIRALNLFLRPLCHLAPSPMMGYVSWSR